MSIETAIFAIQRDGTQYGVAGSDLNDNLIADDILVLSRGGVTSKFTYTGSTDLIEDSDLFVCTDDDGVTYSVTGAQFKTLFGPGPMPWDDHDGGIFHITEVTLGNLIFYHDIFVQTREVTAWKLDGTSLGTINVIEPDSEELVFVTNQNCTNLFNSNLSAKWKFGELTDVSKVTNMSAMFRNAPKFNFNISKWDVGNVTNMNQMFFNGRQFNSDISKWDVDNVTDMHNMFCDARKFNRDISNWNVGNLRDMRGMFTNAYAFNQDISKWDTSNVEDMNSAFFNANVFNSDLSNWDVSNVRDMYWMLGYCQAFNSDIGNWDVSNVTCMGSMLKNAQAFNQDLSGWCVDPEPSHTNFSLNTAMPTDGSNDPKWGTCP